MNSVPELRPAHLLDVGGSHHKPFFVVLSAIVPDHLPHLIYGFGIIGVDSFNHLLGNTPLIHLFFHSQLGQKADYEDRSRQYCIGLRRSEVRETNDTVGDELESECEACRSHRCSR